MSGFFRNGWEYIANSNLHTLRRGTIYAAVAAFAYWVLVTVRGGSSDIRLASMAISLILLGFALTVNLNAKRLRWRTRLIQWLCAAFVLVAFLLVDVASTLGMDDRPGLFYAPFVIVISKLFIKHIWQGLSTVTFSTAIFVLLSGACKARPIYQMDLEIAVITWLVCAVTDVELLQMRLRDFRQREELRRLSCTDGLTGLMNKSTAETAVRNYLVGNAGRESCALFVIDLDQFKQINDILGHRAGDEMLEAFGVTLARLFRAQDIVGRIGGDEFIALMKHVGDPKLVVRKADTVCHAVRHTRLSNFRFSITCSIGVAISNGRETGYDALFKRADEQLYRVKHGAKNGYAVDSGT